MDSSTSDLITQKALRYGLHSCSYCQAVLVDLTSLAHHGTKDDEVDGRQSCEPIHESLDDKIISLYYKNKLFQQFNFSRDLAAPSCPLVELLDEIGDRDDCPINVDSSYPQWVCGPVRLYHFYYLRIPRNLSSSLPGFDSLGPPVDPCVNTDRLFARARGLLDKCLSEHEMCKQTGTSPSRLLDVRQNKTRLVDVESVDDPTWAALSYCWGGPQEAQTTHLNIQDRYREIVVENLPSTIRDAIHVCRQMNIPHLWVDSLCIIQTDDNCIQRAGESDKQRELRKMAGVFSGSVLTISASCASSAKEGFLHDRLAWPPGFAIPVRVNDKHDIAQVIAYSAESRSDLAEYELEPVDSRAWIFQEQILSNRNLNFRTRTVDWTCQCKSFWYSQDEYPLPTFNLTRCSSGHDWNTMVEEYSGRDLSVVQDRPIAIAAVAESYANHNEDVTASDYVAGLWKPTLVNGLLWCVDDREDTTITLEGPSWSWTTVPRRVAFGIYQSLSPVVTIISAEVDLADPNLVFGAAKSGRIRLRGFITQTSRYLPPFKEGDYKGFVYGYDREAEPTKVFLLELGRWDGGGPLHFRHGLILRMTDKATEFVRVGNFRERIHERCESYIYLPQRSCMWHRGQECTCLSYIPVVSCGWTCDREEKVVDIV